jgi:uncharacterized protein YdhG (YjbR/CyaY superfamily)
MSKAEVTEYIKTQPEPMRSTLEAMRKIILEVEPKLEQVIAWKSAMFKLNDKYVVGLCAHKAHISFSPQSADVMTALAEDLADFVVSKSSFQVAQDAPLPKKLITKLVRARLAELK